MKKSIEMIPLGGLGEFGMNCTVLRSGEDMILVDAGVMFPNGPFRGLGIDLMFPDVSYLRENREHLRCILLTHGHEDHIGALPFLLEELPVPVYGSPLALGLVRRRLEERDLHESVPLRVLKPREQFSLGSFTIEPVLMTHSMPDSYAFAIRTPAGTVLWSGDFKFDQSPIDSRLSDMARLAEYGDEGVLLLCSDSTNVAMAGMTPSEQSLWEPIRSIFRKAEGRIFLSCFSSSIHRIQIAMDLAQEFGRKVIALGRSIVSNIEIAHDLGYLHIPPGVLQPLSELDSLSDREIVFIATGSQGEPRSAMNRLAYDQYRRIAIKAGDTVILSARIIPGNERSVSGMINHFYRRGAFVYDSRTTSVHASGHGFQADLKILLNLTRPSYFVPIHGEYRQLAKHALLAREQGLSADQVKIIESGQILAVSEERAEVSGEVAVGYRYIDSGNRDEIDFEVVQERRFMSEDGVVCLIVKVDRQAGRIVGEPEVILRGVRSGAAALDLSKEVSRQALAAGREIADSQKDEELLADHIIRRLRRFFRKTTGKRPLIVPHFQRV